MNDFIGKGSLKCFLISKPPPPLHQFSFFSSFTFRCLNFSKTWKFITFSVGFLLEMNERQGWNSKSWEIKGSCRVINLNMEMFKDFKSLQCFFFFFFTFPFSVESSIFNENLGKRTERQTYLLLLFKFRVFLNNDFIFFILFYVFYDKFGFIKFIF